MLEDSTIVVDDWGQCLALNYTESSFIYFSFHLFSFMTKKDSFYIFLYWLVRSKPFMNFDIITAVHCLYGWNSNILRTHLVGHFVSFFISISLSRSVSSWSCSTNWNDFGTIYNDALTSRSMLVMESSKYEYGTFVDHTVFASWEDV